jgi:ZIP family zinc transporter
MAMLAISVHNLAEGAAIYAIATQDISAGLMLALGVGLHNAPMGMLVYSTLETSRARGAAFLASAALSTFVGGLIMFFLGNLISEAVMLGVVCVALGMIAYILLDELLPAMIRGKNPVRSIIGIAIGAAFVVAGMGLGE